jgi:hypothetical protein
VIFFLATYLLPMIGMGACYLEMGRNLWGSEIIGILNHILLKNYTVNAIGTNKFQNSTCTGLDRKL